MGYACPVCDDPQADAEQLATHLAFAAMLHRDDHADFLDTHVPDWEDRRPPDLAAEVIHHADHVEADAAGLDPGGETVGDTPESGGPGDEAGPVDFESLADGTLDEESQRVVDEARNLFSQSDGSDEDED